MKIRIPKPIIRDVNCLNAKSRKSAGPMHDRRKEVNFKAEMTQEYVEYLQDLVKDVEFDINEPLSEE